MREIESAASKAVERANAATVAAVRAEASARLAQADADTTAAHLKAIETHRDQTWSASASAGHSMRACAASSARAADCARDAQYAAHMSEHAHMRADACSTRCASAVVVVEQHADVLVSRRLTKKTSLRGLRVKAQLVEVASDDDFAVPNET